MKLAPSAKVAAKDTFGVKVDGERVFLLRGFAGALVVLGKKTLSLPKGATVSANDDEGTLAVLSRDGKHVGDRYTWASELWSLVTGKKIATLSGNHPDDATEAEAIVGNEIVCLRKRKSVYSLRTFDLRGKLVSDAPLGKVPLPFHVAVSRDGTLAAHAYFTGAAHLYDRTKKKSHKLVGGTLRIGRQHEKGITDLAFDPSGEFVMYASSGSDAVHVWSTRTKKSVKGTWTKERPDDAFFVAGGLGLIQGTTLTFHALAGKTKPRPVTSADHIVKMNDDQHVVTTTKGRIAVVDVATGKTVASAKGPKTVRDLAASPRRVAVLDEKNVQVFAVT